MRSQFLKNDLGSFLFARRRCKVDQFSNASCEMVLICVELVRSLRKHKPMQSMLNASVHVVSDLKKKTPHTKVDCFSNGGV